MPRGIKTIRWTIEFAASEFDKPRERISLALKNAEERAGKDGKFSTRQIVEALFPSVALEREARAARHRQQIDQAEMTKLERETREGQLMERPDVREGLSDGLTKFAQIIRQSKLKDADRKQLLDCLRAVKLG
jgi:hypothetical protein